MPLRSEFWKSLLENSRPRSVYKKQRLQPASTQNFCKGFENRIACFVFQRLSSYKVWKLFNDNQHEHVNVIEHFRIRQVNQITLPLIINATEDSATTLEITTNKVMQGVPWCTVRWWQVCMTLSISKPVTCRSVVLKSRDRVRALQLSCEHALLEIIWRKQLHRHAVTNQNCEWCLPQILPLIYSFVLNWICLDMWVRVEYRWMFCTFRLVGTKVDGKLTGHK